MNDPLERLGLLAAEAQETLAKLKVKLRLFVVWRLAIFFAVAVASYIFWWSGLPSALILVAGVALFAFAVHRNASVKEAYKVETAYRDLCLAEADALSGKWTQHPRGERHIDSAHPYASDLSIFGPFSLFQFLNRTQTEGGEDVLAHWLKTPLTEPRHIRDEQEIIAGFAHDPDWCLRYLALARIAAGDLDNNPTTAHEGAAAQAPRGGKAWRFIATRLAPTAILGLTVAYAFDFVSGTFYLWSLIASGLTTAAFLKKHQQSFLALEMQAGRASQSKAMLTMLRQRDFDGNPYTEKLEQAAIGESEEALRQLERIQGAIDSRNNVVVGLVLNLLLFWDFQCAYRLYDWQRKYSSQLPGWLAAVAEAEAYVSLALYRFGHPGYVEAEITGTAPDIRIDAGRHPLIIGEAVPNAIDLTDRKRFSIITGANMAGKSTYLRTVGVLALLAMRGLPVPAQHMRMAPARLFTSMLTTDSLGDHASYFFSELSRLRHMVDTLEEGTPHLIILDEILKGTNSVDKAQGSRLFVEKLRSLPAKGLIATHDLSLCELAEAHPGEIVNHRFEVDFVDDDLHFDYQLREGVCQNMNASFLLRKMGLTP